MRPGRLATGWECGQTPNYRANPFSCVLRFPIVSAKLINCLYPLTMCTLSMRTLLYQNNCRTVVKCIFFNLVQRIIIVIIVCKQTYVKYNLSKDMWDYISVNDLLLLMALIVLLGCFKFLFVYSLNCAIGHYFFKMNRHLERFHK